MKNVLRVIWAGIQAWWFAFCMFWISIVSMICYPFIAMVGEISEIKYQNTKDKNNIIDTVDEYYDE